MDKKDDDALMDQFSQEGLQTIQLHVMWCAVEALIQTHPDQAKLRRVFDQLNGQISADLIVQGEPLPAFEVVRRLSAKLFND